MSFILPFQMADGTVLVDYGRVPRGKEGEIRLEEEPYVEVMLDRGEKKSIAVQENNPDEGRWSYRNIEQMAKHYKCQPILFRRISRRTGEIPIAGPPQINLPNRHFEYIVTWYLMSAATFALGFLRR
jgi:cytochrome oxidase assembly protein ShyY1